MDTEYKRKRVAKACQRCRSMKSKRPRLRAGTSDRFSPGVSEGLPDLHDAIHQQERLLDHVISLLPSGPEQEAVLLKSSRIKSQLDDVISSTRTEVTPRAVASDACGKSPSSHADRSPGYLGEVSDIRFVNLVKQFLQTQDGGTRTQDDFESYDQGESLVSPDKAACKTILLPVLEEAQQYITAYFITIHIAYPFIPESRFMQDYKTLRDQGSSQAQNGRSNVRIALLYTICAVGAYYRTLPGKDETDDGLHEKYFLCALTLAPTTNLERSLAQVSLLLARCFYLLVVCRTERNDDIGHTKLNHSLEIEERRRVWYSIYVLDRLLSLQLGRPPAIHDDDFNVPLPARAPDAEIDWTGNVVEEKTDNTPSSGDYFLAVIAFSGIVGRVLRGLYCPRRSHFASGDLLNIKDLDRQLVQWKLALPRVLRFDLGHTFEQSHIFSRQACPYTS
ncbi:Transcription factor, fungi [Metarhizium guizhouense ARSEF 977]|uniref:Transcription factor, fungi n=1 Tax=Metarhizium guizhouense (strain ARSEF 977) TaxID=1276136 RepID=A0A0B4H848_METGA|nr:Transcription factor, fungi [Metarhizium guizhouense ARSEF 977]